MKRDLFWRIWLSMAAALGVTGAQVPPDIAAGLQKIGPIVDPSCTAKLYRPLMPANDYNSNANPLYPGITIARDVSFGPHAKDLIDILTPGKGGGNRPVLIYVPGGGGNKIEQQVREGNAFYDNIGRWAVKNGMVAVLMQRHPGENWDDPAKDVSAMIQWLQGNIKSHKGNPERMFIWAHSAANGPVGTYLGRPEVWGSKGVGVKGAILMSGQWNIAPLQPQGGGRGAGASAFAAAGSTCGASGPAAIDGAISGPSSANISGGRGGGPGRGGPVDPATQEAQSTLPELRKTKVKLMFVTAEFDPGVNGGMSAFYQTLHDDLCAKNAAQCPTLFFAKGQSHMSEVFAIDTADTSVSGPILAWIKRIR